MLFMGQTVKMLISHTLFNVGMLKLFLLLYADDIILFANDKELLQLSLNILQNYCKRWKLKVNTQKTKVMVFKKGGRLQYNISFYYDGAELEIVSKFVYLGVTFTGYRCVSDCRSRGREFDPGPVPYFGGD